MSTVYDDHTALYGADYLEEQVDRLYGYMLFDLPIWLAAQRIQQNAQYNKERIMVTALCVSATLGLGWPL